MKKKQVNDNADKHKGETRNFQSLQSDDAVKGWILIAKGIHEEAQEDDLFDAFKKYGPIKNLHQNLDRRTGFVQLNLVNLPMLKMLEWYQQVRWNM